MFKGFGGRIIYTVAPPWHDTLDTIGTGIRLLLLQPFVFV